MIKIKLFNRIGSYLNEVKGELKKVTWPTKNDLQKTTVAVIVISIIFGIYLQVVDFSFRVLVEKVIAIFK
ncbi:MAG: preprotein translocase subunit SecE [Candidatus Aminicenantes bacterium]|nr:preprotein translocase subunit SecE [Candidatus Aminicenantes bacterium]